MSTTDKVMDRVGYQLKRAQQALRTRMDGALREQGITTAQYAALSALEAEAPLSGAELARRCFVTPQTMSAIVVRLEQARLVERIPHAEHGRVIETHLSDTGRALLHDAHRVVLAIEERMLAGIDTAERRRFTEALRRCAGNLAENSE
jgi:DNA-binding MarR family transcriptional regulator